MRLGINVSNGLLKRLEPLKPGINISQVCRDALENRATHHERAVERAREDGMGLVADEYAREHSSKEVNWDELGHEDARDWFKLAANQDIQNLFHNMGVMRSEGKENFIPIATRFPEVKTVWERINEFEDWFMWQYEMDGSADHHFRAQTEYTRAWIAYSRAVEQLIEDRIRANAAAEKVKKRTRTSPEYPVNYEHI